MAEPARATAGGEHPRSRLDPVIHQPVRFSVMATLAETDEAEFAFVRDAVQLTDSALSKAVSVLEDAGYVKVRKAFVGKFPRTWLKLTKSGHDAFAAHLAALRDIVGG